MAEVHAEEKTSDVFHGLKRVAARCVAQIYPWRRQCPLAKIDFKIEGMRSSPWK